MGGGKYDYANAYKKYKDDVEDAQFESYVDANPDLVSAWESIQSDPSGTSGAYWTPRGATSKAAFGRAHAAEDAALRSGDYRGATAVDPYSGDTRFESWQDVGADDTVVDGGWAAARGGGAPGAANYPIGLVDYQEPSAMSGIPLDFQPWLQPGHIPDSLWNYQAPTLNEWEVPRNWDWATKPASEYMPKSDEEKTEEEIEEEIRGDIDPDKWAGYENVQEAMEFANQAANIQATQDALELASQSG